MYLDITGKTPENLIEGLKTFVESEKEKDIICMAVTNK